MLKAVDDVYVIGLVLCIMSSFLIGSLVAWLMGVLFGVLHNFIMCPIRITSPIRILPYLAMSAAF